VAAFLGLNDLDRESRNLQQLFLIKGESHIKYLGLALAMKWVDDTRPDSFSNMLIMERDPDIMFIATTNNKGDIRGVVSRQNLLPSNSLGTPEPPVEFHPDWSPKFKTVSLMDGQKAFVVYRPTLFNLLPPPEPPSHHRPPPENKEPPWPPENINFGNSDKAIYVWIGFSDKEFEKAANILRINALIFSALTLMVIAAFLLALSWLNKFINNHSLTNEIITRLPLGLVLDNASGKVVLANRAAQKLAGLTEEEFLGRSLKELTHGDFPDDRELTSKEADISFRDSPSLRLSIYCGPIIGPSGAELGRVVLMSDLGELNRLKDALAKQERMAKLGGLASGLAHEIRNPLGAIKGLTQHLINKSSDTDESDALAVILNCVERMARAITDFQAYANPSINAERLELTEFLSSLHDEARKEMAGSPHGAKLGLPNTQLFVQADPGQLAVALTGLYHNAFQAMDRNPGNTQGLLTVTLKRTGANTAIITFSDNGPGFGEQQLKTPFVPYFSSKAQRSGLGLAKANNIIQAFKGNVKLGNNPDGGALVTVSLPLEYERIIELRTTELEMAQFMRDIHAFISFDPKFKGVSLSLGLPEGSYIIKGDKDRLTEAITNVYINAMQATEANPPDQPARLSVALSGLGNGKLSISFDDNGPGFSQSQLDNPFVPFFTTKAKGMGLGMSIVRNVIEAHQGEVSIGNMPGGGARVVLTLPRWEKPHDSMGPLTGTAAGHDGGDLGRLG
jgi:two-component system sensor histidine kinase HydH